MRMRPRSATAAFTNWFARMSSVNSSYRTSTGKGTPNLRRTCSATTIRPRTVCNASSSVRYPWSSPREKARRAAETKAGINVSAKVSAFSKRKRSSRNPTSPMA